MMPLYSNVGMIIEKNIHGAWVIWGDIGIKQYYGYTKAEAKAMYKNEASKKVFVEQR